jgi:hypothetical protein
MPAPGYVTFGGVEVVLSRQNSRAPVPIGADVVSDHHHPGTSGEMTRWDLGALPASFACEVVCKDYSTFQALLSKRRAPQSFSGGDAHLSGSWSMTIEEDGASELGGVYYVQARFVRM